MRIGIIGRGAVGTALGTLMGSAGHDVLTAGRAQAGRAVAHGEVALLAIPYDACATALPPLADALAGKVMVDVTNPVGPDWAPLSVRGSAAEEIARLVPGTRVVKAFNTIFADAMTPARLDRDGQPVTAFVAGDEAAAREIVMSLARDAGFAPLDAGSLRAARYLEAMAHLNIAMALSGGGTDAAFLYHRRAA